jgi:hypothetical protein
MFALLVIEDVRAVGCLGAAGQLEVLAITAGGGGSGVVYGPSQG